MNGYSCGSEQGRVTVATVDSSLGRAKAAGDELPVPPAATAAGDPAYLIPPQACRSLWPVMPVLLLLSVSAVFYGCVSVAYNDAIYIVDRRSRHIDIFSISRYIARISTSEASR